MSPSVVDTPKNRPVRVNNSIWIEARLVEQVADRPTREWPISLGEGLGVAQRTNTADVCDEGQLASKWAGCRARGKGLSIRRAEC